MKIYFKIGRFVATHGLKGEVVLKHSLGKKTSLKGLEAVFIEERADAFLPYFIESARIKNDAETYLRIEGLHTKEAAHALVKHDVWMLEDDFKKFASSAAPISFLGFTMINNGEPLGEILEVIEQPHQVLCKILLHGEEALIPLHENSLEKIDKKKRAIFVTMPEGLLEIYSSTGRKNNE